jgi:DNA polymerase III delta prime subunit
MSVDLTADLVGLEQNRGWQLAAARGEVTSEAALDFVRNRHATYASWAHRDPEMAEALAEGDLRYSDDDRRWPEAEPPPATYDAETTAELDRIIDEGARGQATDIRTVPGGDWLLDAPEGIPAVCGTDDEVLWAEGEPLLICGPPGVGKTTIAGQLVWARLGLLPDLLGYPVTPTSSKVLYLAMDRPRQIQRAFGRLARPEHRDVLNERLMVRPGPPPKDMAKHPELLAYMANAAGADTIIVDSLKDAAVGLSDDEVGAGLNRAIQTVMAEGIELAALHHQRKGVNGTKPKTLEDLYGSTWIAAGAGSVVLLWGQPGDAIVELVHLKQPGAVIGPLKIEHDHSTGRSSVSEGFDLLAYLRGQPRPVTARDAAHARHAEQPSANQEAAMRGALGRLVKKGLAVKTEAEAGGAGGQKPALYGAAVRAS